MKTFLLRSASFIGSLYLMLSIFLQPCDTRRFLCAVSCTRSIILLSSAALVEFLPISLQLRYKGWKPAIKHVNDLAWFAHCMFALFSLAALWERLLLVIWMIPAYVDPYTYGVPTVFVPQSLERHLLPTAEWLAEQGVCVTRGHRWLSRKDPLFMFICAARAELAETDSILLSFAATTRIPCPHDLAHAVMTFSERLINGQIFIDFVPARCINPSGEAHLAPRYGKVIAHGDLRAAYCVFLKIDERLARLWEEERRDGEHKIHGGYHGLLKAVLWRGMLKVMEIQMTGIVEGDSRTIDAECFV